MDFFIALDFSDLKKMKDFVKLVYPIHKYFKIGLEICTIHGVSEVLDALDGFDDINIFLDLKLHDIPNTVCSTIKTLTKYKQIKYLTLHASNGITCLQEANKISMHIKLLGVSVLTSLDNAECQEVYTNDCINQVLNFAQIITKSGIYGMICSGLESKYIRENKEYDNIKLICPGIRFKGMDLGDQSRVVYIEDLKNYNINYAVIGRTVTKSPDPVGIIEKINNAV